MARDQVRRRVVVSGRVQGVGFRAAVRRRARAAEVHGWVTNRGDGSVEAVLEGSPGAVERVVEFLRDGPRMAVVSDLRISSDEEPEGLSGFEVR